MKERIDQLLVARGLAASREEAKRLILAGEVRLEGKGTLKPGTRVQEDVALVVRARGEKYVSRGGEKLAGALKKLGFSPAEKIALDVGASTGGFTDCLLRGGAKKVYALDVGRGMLAEKLRADPRVVVMERMNARYLKPEDLPEKAGIATIDVSFISLEKIIPAVKGVLESGGQIVALIKPQFEAGREEVSRGGVVRKKEIVVKVLDRIRENACREGFDILGLTVSPLRGPAGNVEFFLLLGKGRETRSWESWKNEALEEAQSLGAPWGE